MSECFESLKFCNIKGLHHLEGLKNRISFLNDRYI